jgi:hypothetical protein
MTEGADNVDVRTIEAAELALILEGIDLDGARRRPSCRFWTRSIGFDVR